MDDHRHDMPGLSTYVGPRDECPYYPCGSVTSLVKPSENPPEDLDAAMDRVGDPPEDILQDLINKQLKFRERLLAKYPDRYGTKLDQFKEEILMAGAELFELLNWLPWKKHKEDFGRSLTLEEQAAAIEEAVDLMHFTLNMFCLLGVHSSRSIWKLYAAKHLINNERQDRGY